MSHQAASLIYANALQEVSHAVAHGEQGHFIVASHHMTRAQALVDTLEELIFSVPPARMKATSVQVIQSRLAKAFTRLADELARAHHPMPVPGSPSSKQNNLDNENDDEDFDYENDEAVPGKFQNEDLEGERSIKVQDLDRVETSA